VKNLFIGCLLTFLGTGNVFGQDGPAIAQAMRASLPASAECQWEAPNMPYCKYDSTRTAGDNMVHTLILNIRDGGIQAYLTSEPTNGVETQRLVGMVTTFFEKFGFDNQKMHQCLTSQKLMQTGTGEVLIGNKIGTCKVSRGSSMLSMVIRLEASSRF
jgi:hypothetical protein